MRRRLTFVGSALLLVAPVLPWAHAAQNCGWACYAPVADAVQHRSGWYVSPWISAALALMALISIVLGGRLSTALGAAALAAGATCVVAAVTKLGLDLDGNLVVADARSPGLITATAGCALTAVSQLVTGRPIRRHDALAEATP